MIGRLFKPHSPSPPGEPKTLTMKLSSHVQKRCHGLWRQRHAELSDEGILTLYKSPNDRKVYDLNLPKKMVVGAGKSSLHMKLITNDGVGLHLKVKGNDMELWAKRMMDLKFPNKEAAIETDDENSLSLDDSVVDYADYDAELPNDTMTTVYESDNVSLWSGKPVGTVEIGAGLPLTTSRVSMESMDKTQHTSEEHLGECEEIQEMEARNCEEKAEVKEEIKKEETKETEQVKEEKPLVVAKTPFPSKDTKEPSNLPLDVKKETIVRPKEVAKKEEDENGKGWKPGHVARMATMIDRRVRAERKRFSAEEEEQA